MPDRGFGGENCTMRRLVVLATVALSLWASPVLAQVLEPEDRQAVEAQIAVLDRTVAAGDFAGALDVVPPRLLAVMAARFGIDEDQVRQAVRDASRTMMQGVEFTGYAMNLDAAVRYRTPDGARFYLLIPTTMDMRVEGVGPVRVRSHTLAFEDDGWWLLRVSDAPQVALLREIYPEFIDVEFPQAETTTGD